MISKERLENLNERLPEKPIEKIQLKLVEKNITVSDATIRRFLKGTAHRIEFLRAAVEVMEEYELTQEKLEGKLDVGKT